jgi:carboxypeptidase Taq
MNSAYQDYRIHKRKIADVNYSAALMQWDMEIYMPPLGGDFRAQQISTLSGIAHELSTDEKFGKTLEKLSDDPSLSEKERRNIEESLKDFNRNKKYTTEFVETLSRTVSEAVQVWTKAKKESDFRMFAPLLEKLISLKRQECEILGYDDHPYDALLDLYEPGAKTREIDALFKGVKEWLVGFVKQISSRPQNENSFMFRNYEKNKQWDFGVALLKQMGYDFNAGRQDISAHPFSTSFNCRDVRVTTRISENDLNEMIWSCIHEGGHALYEQGLNEEDYGLPSGEAISLGIHESQSRLWENHVGRSHAYWKANYKKLQELFPRNLEKVSVDDFYKAMNVVQPSFIRTSADELTYHFHVLIRFEIEKALIEKSIGVKELPEIWNAKYKTYLGIDVPNDSKGVLQDIHWSYGSFGYFPTYSLGSFYSAQFFSKAGRDIPHLEKEIESGNMKPLLGWLRENIHQHGKVYPAEALCKKVTGEKLNFNYFRDYANKKYAALYNL